MLRVQEKGRETPARAAPAPEQRGARGAPFPFRGREVAWRVAAGRGRLGWGARPLTPLPQNLVRWCDSSPCKNGGRCWQTNAQYRCECHSGWTGLYCDVPSVSCEVAAWQQGDRPPPAL